MKKNTTIKRKTISGIITSLLVLILVFVGTSTATYAWYSAINRAIGDSITFTSSTQGDVGGDLTIGWLPDSTASELAFDKPESSLYPMIPKTQATIGITTYDDFISDNFNYSAQSWDDNLFAYICTFAGRTVNPFLCTGNDGAHNKFYVINKKETSKQTVTARYTIAGDLAPFLRVAMFMGEDVYNMTLQGILSNSDTIYYDEIEENDIVNNTPTMVNVHVESGNIKFLLNENEAKVVALVAWLDGVNINDDHLQKSTTFNIGFEGVQGDLIG